MGNFLSLEGNMFAEAAEKLDKLGADLQGIFTVAMQKAGEKVQADTHSAMAKGNLPAGGKYSQGETEGTIVDPKVITSGTMIEVPVGFDKTKKGAGGWLITGTPKMSPDGELNKIYKGKKYNTEVKKIVADKLKSEIAKRMG